ncbi:helix-turn-helix transcriptional regulator [Chitinophaga agrisoli]|uniref:Helix-turn-helix transcriptional regulator n=2 Tax=Chitinophaga agrisoli TaxID=2607653 RepID=A0A5B2VZW4_9BACT|nr:helix-turn-helix transcriptional regulator [Chitinophaga agrisoli]
MKANAITTCYVGPEISPEQFIPEHFFLYLAKGKIEGYDGHRKYVMKAGDYVLACKNQLARYNKHTDKGAFEKVVVVFDQAFLKGYMERYKIVPPAPSPKAPFIPLQKNELVPHFIQSLTPYYNNENNRIGDPFLNVKREELLMILLQHNSELAGILFDFREPEKLDLEAYMNRNYKFNVHLERFAYLTGRSLSVFKRDFAAIFSDTPNRWLTQRRLQEAYFLLDKKGAKPSEIYLDLGFENLSHFSFAFKKKYGIAPTELSDRKKQALPLKKA